ncbi:hypothetical protein ACH5RR_003223 [Cinchona calisaya]|uniref:Uncharacterized protein n=1 Tax=Cinchona calisaya TaxID=153742 RepID=A0ABD3AUW0_9GENT
MAAFQCMTRGQPLSHTPKSFAFVLSSNLAMVMYQKPQVYHGKLTLIFTNGEIVNLSKALMFALVRKFGNVKPSMAAIRKNFLSIGFQGSFSQGFPDYHHV